MNIPPYSFNLDVILKIILYILKYTMLMECTDKGSVKFKLNIECYCYFT